VETFARTGGRPLGLRFAPDGRLMVADAARGLLAVDREGRVETLSTEEGGTPYRLTDDLDVARDGTVYFTDASSRFGLGDSIADLVTHHALGRLLAFDPRTRATRLLLGGLYFANGVALAPDESFLLVVETGTYRIRRYWLQGPRAGAADVFVDNLPAIPDGVSSNGRDRFWVSLVAPRDPLLDGSHPHPWMKKALLRLPTLVRPGPKRYGFVLGLDLEGRVVTNLQDPSGSTFALVTNAVEHSGRLYLGTLSDEAIGRLALPARTTTLAATKE
jgi:sugar lactone lactonase YvrE